MIIKPPSVDQHSRVLDNAQNFASKTHIFFSEHRLARAILGVTIVVSGLNLLKSEFVQEEPNLGAVLALATMGGACVGLSAIPGEDRRFSTVRTVEVSDDQEHLPTDVASGTIDDNE